MHCFSSRQKLLEFSRPAAGIVHLRAEDDVRLAIDQQRELVTAMHDLGNRAGWKAQCQQQNRRENSHWFHSFGTTISSVPALADIKSYSIH